MIFLLKIAVKMSQKMKDKIINAIKKEHLKSVAAIKCREVNNRKPWEKKSTATYSPYYLMMHYYHQI